MILVFGKTGQVATELQRQGAVTALGRDAADLSDPAACAKVIEESNATCVINAAAYTAVDRAEDDEALATVINGDAPAAMAAACAAKGIPFLHLSTDYVFDGSGDTPWQPADPVSPLNAYGRSKLAGELGIVQAGGRSAILRTSWVVSSHGSNFVKTMLRLSQTRDALAVVEDQIGGPTPAADIAATLLRIAAPLGAGQGGGVYHYGGIPWVSWKEFATEIFAQAHSDITVTGIPGAQYPTPAARPHNSRLDCARLTRDFGIAPPDWKAGLAQILSELEATL
ncbi:dTDP-4-dehydrorhamnose reductase [Thioclava sp. F34-6]|uniref:dTDP-4-dehydrorhamnose reductase n=1 Tax=Thioclava sp. F34-6 TaxID=1973003 RepID=UPI000B542C68|nr:dTDP-4-dehydrorhamnose reductase [Thioclava sp. F34-6]OWY08444.1 dTDP-4-dehydrorhamnose reductase [Thioclava sp. F34-6]